LPAKALQSPCKSSAAGVGVPQRGFKEGVGDFDGAARTGQAAQGPEGARLEGFFHEVLGQKGGVPQAEVGPNPQDLAEGFRGHSAEVPRLVVHGPEEGAEELPERGLAGR